MQKICCAVVLAVSVVFGAPAMAATADSHLGVDPQDLVTLQWMCNIERPTRLLPNGERVEDFEIPRHHLLVITDLEWRVTVTEGGIGQNYIAEVHLTNGDGLTSYPYLAFIPLVQFRAYLADHLTGGLVLDSSVSLDNTGTAPHPRLSLFGVAPGTPDVPNCNAVLRGYLVRG